MCSREFWVNVQLTHSEEGTSLKALSNPTLPDWYYEFCLIFDGEFIHKHCLTDIPKLETFDKSTGGMSTDNKRQLVLFYVTGIPTENVPRELATCFREVLDNGGTIHAEPYGEPAPSPSHWPEQHEVGGGVILPGNYITDLCHQHMTRSSVCWDTLFSKRKQEVPEDQCHINRISVTVYCSFNVYHDTFYWVFHFSVSMLVFDLGIKLCYGQWKTF